MASRANWKSWSIPGFIDLGQLRSVRISIDHIAKCFRRDVEEKALVVSSDRTSASSASCWAFVREIADQVKTTRGHLLFAAISTNPKPSKDIKGLCNQKRRARSREMADALRCDLDLASPVV